MKKCTKCKVEKPKSTEYFSQRPDGYWHSWCKICTYKNSKKYRKNNPQKVKEYNSRYINDYQKNKKIATSKKGVYAIFEMGKCLYVGESSWLKQRIWSHNSYIKNPLSASKNRQPLYYNLQQHSSYVIGILEETENHKEKEQYYINKLKPLYNG